jgi:hypothetical protein
MDEPTLNERGRALGRYINAAVKSQVSEAVAGVHKSLGELWDVLRNRQGTVANAARPTTVCIEHGDGSRSTLQFSPQEPDGAQVITVNNDRDAGSNCMIRIVGSRQQEAEAVQAELRSLVE